MKRIIPVALLLLLACSPSLAQSNSDAEKFNQLKSLEGILDFEVTIGPLSVEAEQAGLVRSEIEEAVLTRLRRKELPARRLALRSDSSLVVRLVPRYESKFRAWTVGLNVELIQAGKLLRTDAPCYAITWRRMEVLTTGADFKEVKERLAAMIDEFAKEYRTANP